MRRRVLLSAVLLACSAFLVATIPGSRALASAHAATAAHRASIPPCGQTISGEVLTPPSNFSAADIDQNNTCGGRQLLAKIPVAQDAAHVYTLAFTFSNMGAASPVPSSFDAWIAFRHVDTCHKYSLHFLSNRIEFRRRMNCAISVLASVAYTPPSTPTPMVLTIAGYTFSLAIDGTTVLSATDTHQAIASANGLVFYSMFNTFACWDAVAGSQA